MSLSSWKKEFMAEPAEKAARKSWSDALEHSIRKWRGLYPSALKKHGLRTSKDRWELSILNQKGGRPLVFSCDNCALCCKTRVSGILSCKECVIPAATGETCVEVFVRAEETKTPTQMLKLLRSVRKFAKGF